MKRNLKVLDPIVSVDWLNAHLDHQDLIIFDATIQKATDTSFSKLKSPYIKNALFFDIKNDFSDVNAPFPNTMLSPELFQIKARESGVNNNSCIVVYDQYGYYSCARVWWMFKTMGFQNIAVLDGGLPKWLESEFSVQEYASKPKGNGDFDFSYNSNMIVNHIPVLKAITDNEKVIVDARAYQRFLGTEPEPRTGLRSGHIPNSKSIPYSSLLTNGKLKQKKELIDIYKDYKNKDIIFSCGSGITACILALGAEIAGIKNISVYDGSWTEWGSLDELPVEK